MANNEISYATSEFFGIKNVLDFQRDSLNFLVGLNEKHEDIIRFKFGPQYDVFLLTHPDYIRELLVKQADRVVKWDRSEHIVSKFAKHNLIILEGDVWKQARRLSAPAFHTKRIREYIQIMVEHTEKLISKWEDGAVYDMQEQMTEVTMGIIGEILFNIKDIEKDAAELSKALFIILEMFMLESTAIMPVPDWVPTPRNLRENQAMKYAQDYLMKIIEERRASGKDYGDMLSALLQAVDEENGASLKDTEVRDMLFSFFTAGHETTAQALTWELGLISKHGDIQDKLYAEISTVMQGSSPSLEDLGRMTYTDKVFQETMRLYPPAWSLFLRQIVEAVELGGNKLPVGALIYISPYVVHRDPRWWENPESFNPERFNEGWKERIPAYAFIPFGGGTRVCIGSHLAEMEAEVILATMLKHFSFELVETDQEMEIDALFTLHVKNGMPLRVRKRA